MGLKEDLTAEVQATFRAKWEEQIATAVPEADSLRLNDNHAKQLAAATVLYADIDGSTNMVDTHTWSFSAEIYKAYLRCASQIIKNESGAITAYDGDRVMAVFVGDNKNTAAVRTALKINYAVEQIIRPAYAFYENGFLLKHVIGIDTSTLRAARVGVRGDNDLVWVGRAANHAAKLCSLSSKSIWITQEVYDFMHSSVKTALNGAAMWEPHIWNSMNKRPIHASNYVWNSL